MSVVKNKKTRGQKRTENYTKRKRGTGWELGGQGRLHRDEGSGESSSPITRGGVSFIGGRNRVRIGGDTRKKESRGEE